MSRTVAATLRRAANLIENGYWYRGVNVSGGAYVVTADNTATRFNDWTPASPTRGGCIYTAAAECDPSGEEPAATFLRKYLGLFTNTDVFTLNDGQPLETGRQWAIDTLRAAADAAEAAA